MFCNNRHSLESASYIVRLTIDGGAVLAPAVNVSSHDRYIDALEAAKTYRVGRSYAVVVPVYADRCVGQPF